mmetsp:Transcript_11039/g.18021  ORF Transcript_11039/g.18021 Transcript_11039/m.18021 type:complete len:415 (-) Transcript_11039:56-1300(-)
MTWANSSLTKVLSAVAVHHEVGGSLNIGDLVGTGIGKDLLGQGGGGKGAVLREELGTGSAYLGGGHGGTRDGVGGRRGANPGRGDGRARAEDISASTVVGVAGTGVVDVRSGNGDGTGLRSGGVAAGIGVVVTSGNHHGHTSIEGSLDSVILHLRKASTQRKVGNGLAASDGRLASDPVDAINNTTGGAGASVGENLDSNQVRLLGGTPSLASNGTGTMGTMSIAISLIRNSNNIGDRGVTEGARSGLLAGEVIILAINTSVNDVGIHIRTRSTSGVVIGVSVGGVVVSMVDSLGSPVSIRLRHAIIERDSLVLLHVLHVLALKHTFKTTSSQLHGVGTLVAIGHVLIHMEGGKISGELLAQVSNVALEGLSVNVVMKTDNVRVGNSLGRVGFAKVSARGNDSEGGNNSFLHLE